MSLIKDYINPDDGLKYCGSCNTPKEAYFEAGHSLLGMKKHPIECKCAREKRKAEEAETASCQHEAELYRLRSKAFCEIPAYKWRFENAGVMTPQLLKAKNYAESFGKLYPRGIGLLLFGNVGTGKSYAAGCIANALIDELHSVSFISTSEAVNSLQGRFGSEREEYLNSLLRPELLILDDLGSERSTSYGREQIFSIVDKRILTGKPLIVTTNIPLKLMKESRDISDRRIYDRILSVCLPLCFEGRNFRKEIKNINMKSALALMDSKINKSEVEAY